MNWYIGQDIVCIKTHSQGYVKEGQVFTIVGLMKGCCRIVIDVGIRLDSHDTVCAKCKKKIIKGTPIVWCGDVLFTPLETLVDISEIEEILKEPAFN